MLAACLYLTQIRPCQMFEYLNISDVDALRALIEKLITDADEFAADIRRKDHTITELQIKVHLEGYSASLQLFRVVGILTESLAGIIVGRAPGRRRDDAECHRRQVCRAAVAVSRPAGRCPGATEPLRPHTTRSDPSEFLVCQVELSKTRQALRHAHNTVQEADVRAADAEARLAEKILLANEAAQFREQALHHARFRDDALREGEELKRKCSQLEFDKLGLETLLDRTRNELAVCERHNFQLTESLTAQRAANAGLSSEVGILRSMRDRNKMTAAEKILSKWSKFMLARPFEKWKENAEEFREWRIKGRKAVLRMVMLCAGRAFSRWVENHKVAPLPLPPLNSI